jgi:hypothetical protein
MDAQRSADECNTKCDAHTVGGILPNCSCTDFLSFGPFILRARATFSLDASGIIVCERRECTNGGAKKTKRENGAWRTQQTAFIASLLTSASFSHTADLKRLYACNPHSPFLINLIISSCAQLALSQMNEVNEVQ